MAQQPQPPSPKSMTEQPQPEDIEMKSREVVLARSSPFMVCKYTEFIHVFMFDCNVILHDHCLIVVCL